LVTFIAYFHHLVIPLQKMPATDGEEIKINTQNK